MKLYRSTLAQVRDGSGARCAVDHGQFAHHRPEAEDSKDAFTAIGRADARFEQAILYPVASISFVPGYASGSRMTPPL
jgi:hypothetical protein